MNLPKKLGWPLLVLCGLATLWLWAPGFAVAQGGQTPFHLVVLGDPHIPGKFLPEKEAVLRTINSWPEVALVVAVGDICEDVATEKEFAAARQFFSKLTKPFMAIPGNHDFIYEDIKSSDGKKMLGSAPERQKKLATFQRTFGLPALYHSRMAGKYHLIFLATDDLADNQLARLSKQQLAWLEADLRSHQQHPTVIFFHAPLRDTLTSYNKYANTDDFIAQPQDKIHDLLKNNPQVFLWVCGHVHLPATNPNFRAPINLYDQRVYTLHNSDLNRQTIWTNSLFLYRDKVVIKTYNHKQGAWMPEMEKTLKN
jgi:predicted MPP superfamily phosphohydrolase